MKLSHLFKLFAPDDDTGNNNGGGGAGDSGASGSNDSYRPEDGDVDGSDIAFYNRHQQRIGGRTTDGKLPKGSLQSALEKALGDDGGKGNQDPKDDDFEDDLNDEGEGSSKKEDTKQKGAAKEGDKKPAKESDKKEDDDGLDIDPSSLRSKSGAPISNEAADNFNKLKEAVRKYKKEADELRTKVSQSTENGTDPAEVKKLKDELEELKRERDIESFETSAAFKEVYEAPLEASKAAVLKFFPKEMEEADLIKSTALLKEAHAAAVGGDELKFYQIVDELNADIIPGGQSMKNAFLQRMEKYYEKLSEWAVAKADKSKEREKFVQDKMVKIRSDNTRTAEAGIDTYVTRLLADKSELLDGIEEDVRKEYIDSLENNKKTAKAHIAKMAATGTISDELGAIIQKGIAADSLLTENRILANGFKDAAAKLEIMEKRLAKYEKKRENNSKDKESVRYVNNREAQSTDKSARRPGESAIEWSIRKQREAGNLQ